MGIIARVTKAAAKAIPLPGSGYTFGSWTYAVSRAYTDEAWRGSVGDGSHSSIVEACINYMARTFPEAPPAVWKTKRDGTREIDAESPITALLKRPTPYHSGPLLWAATLASWVIDGNAYWLKVRAGGAGGGRVIQLWYVPHWMIEPKSRDSASTFITHYDYTPRGVAHAVNVEDVIHFRHGIDPENVRKGRSPIADQLREVFTDEEAARFTASLIRNYGVPGLVITPETGVTLEEEEMEAAKTKMMEKTGGQRRGEPIVMNAAMKVMQFGFSPAALDLAGLRDIPEERVTAALGLPNPVVGFGSGLQNTTANATLREWREQAWEGCIIPNQRLFAADLGVQLVPEFVAGSALGSTELGFDLSHVRVLQEDENKRAERDVKIWLAGGMTRGEFRGNHDLPTTPADDVFAVPLGITLIPRDELTETIEPEPVPDALAAPEQQLALGPGETEPDADAAEKPPKRKATATTYRDAALIDGIVSLRDSLAKIAEKRVEAASERELLTEALRATERSSAAQGAAFVEGMRHVAEAIASRPTELVITPAAEQRGTVDSVERDERGNITRIVRTPAPVAVAEQNGHGAS